MGSLNQTPKSLMLAKVLESMHLTTKLKNVQLGWIFLRCGCSWGYLFHIVNDLVLNSRSTVLTVLLFTCHKSNVSTAFPL